MNLPPASEDSPSPEGAPPTLPPTLPPATWPSEYKVCPDCAEGVRAAARICRYCRYNFVTARSWAPPDAVPLIVEERRRPLATRVFLRTLPILVGLLILVVVFAVIWLHIISPALSSALSSLPPSLRGR
jgi:hypothetical protein